MTESIMSSQEDDEEDDGGQEDKHQFSVAHHFKNKGKKN